VTVVGIGIYVNQLLALDPVRGSYDFRGNLRATWCDPRLAFDAAAAGVSERVYSGAEAEAYHERIWTPGGFAANRSGDFSVTERVLRVAADGTVHNDINISTTLSARFDLRRFPFDEQTLPFVVESIRWPSTRVVFIPDETTMGFPADFSMQEWAIQRIGSRLELTTQIRNPLPFSQFIFEVQVKRLAGFYLWKVLLPILLIVAISWSVFWMSDERLAGRSRITATGVLTVVAYQFVVAEGLPRIAYLTVLDKVMLVSFSLLAVTVLQSMLVARYQDSDMERAHQIDRTSRWLFPLAYALLLLLVVATS
jgi:hypothetical protein